MFISYQNYGFIYFDWTLKTNVEILPKTFYKKCQQISWKIKKFENIISIAIELLNENQTKMSHGRKKMIYY